MTTVPTPSTEGQEPRSARRTDPAPADDDPAFIKQRLESLVDDIPRLYGPLADLVWLILDATSAEPIATPASARCDAERVASTLLIALRHVEKDAVAVLELLNEVALR